MSTNEVRANEEGDDEVPDEGVVGFPLSPQQEHLWLLQQAGSAAPYRVWCTCRIRGPLKVERLVEALRATVRRHEILRIGLRRLPGMAMPLQIVTDPGEAGPDLALRGGLKEAPAGDSLDELRKEVAQEALDLEGGTPLAVRWATLSPTEHLLGLCLPGLFADAITLDNLLLEVARRYESLARGDVEAQDEPVQYIDIAQFFRDILVAEETAAGREYWRRFHPEPPFAALLPLESRPAAGPLDFQPRSLGHAFAAKTLAGVTALGGGPGFSMEAFFFACWQHSLCRLTDRPDLIVAAAAEGRRYEGLDRALGLFARHLPVPVSQQQDPRLGALALQVGRDLEAGRKWQESFSWDLLINDSATAQVLRFWPFCFEFLPPARDVSVEAVTFSPSRGPACWDRFKLRLSMLEEGTGLLARLDYDAGALDRPVAERVASAFAALVESFLERPEAPASQLSILGEAERHQLLLAFNDTAIETGDGRGLHHLVERQVEATPEAVAVVADGFQVTYRELDRRANRLAHRLRGSGVGPESVVAVCLERSVGMVIALLGVLKAGGAYLPVDPEYPGERLSYMLGDAGASVLVTGPGLGDVAPGSADDCLRLDLAGENEGWSDSTPEPLAWAANPAYVIYTSGSTGRPKGVVIAHKAIANRLLWMARVFPLTAADRVLQKTPYGFDASIWEIFSPLLAGAGLVLAGPGAHRDTAQMAELVARHQVTRLQLVPTLLGAFLEEPGLAGCGSLSHLFCGGEALRSDLKERFFARLEARLVNLYGPTEAAIDACFEACRERDGRGRVTIGRPLDNVRAYVVDPALRAVALGMTGMLHVGGAGLARGYLGQPALTAERFLPDPFGPPGERLYATGDLVRHLPDGTLEYLGRTDHQVKIRGVRLELGEIEARLAEHEAVAEAVAVVRSEDAAAPRLVAYVVPSRREELALQSVRTHRLPNGLDVAYVNRNEADLIYREIFEDTYLRHGIHLDDGDCVFDVGANIGLFSLFVHQQCHLPRVFAFEPIPPIFDRLRSNVALYDLDTRIFECGLGSVSGSALFTFYPNWSGMSGRFADPAEDAAVTLAVLRNLDRRLAAHADDLLEGRFEAQTFSCRVRTLSDVIAQHGVERIELLKIDVEKSELEVLRGIAEPDWGKVRQIVVEAHGRDEALEPITDLLVGHGFDVTVDQDGLLKDTSLYNLYAVQRAARQGAPRRRATDAVPPPALKRRPFLTSEALRSYLAERLPETMVPATLVILDVLPRLPNGKVDRAALPAPARSAAVAGGMAPRSPEEKVLSAIWSKLLGLEQVGIHDNFFELGGDSILSIQVVSRARTAGLKITAQQIFTHQTIAGLAAIALPLAPASSREEGTRGPVPLTPAQHWFFEQDLPAAHHYGQALLLEVRRPLAPGLLAGALQALALHHESLRLHFELVQGAWRPQLAPSAAVPPLTAVDLSGLAPERHGAAIEEAASRAQTALDLRRGPLQRGVFFDLGAPRPGRLLLVIHHLLSDGVSWRILLEDLETACRQGEAGEAHGLPPRTASFSHWASRLAEHARAMPLEPELSWWREETAAAPAPLPVDGAGANTVASGREISSWLTAEETQALLQEVPAAYRTQINDVLLAALSQTLASPGHPLLVDLEGHGREDILDGVDVSRTVGWFTTTFPVRLEPCPELGATLKRVKEHLRQVPGHGIGYGLLRYLRDDPEVASLPRRSSAEVSFNYLGQFDQVFTRSSLFGPASEPIGPLQSPAGRRTHVLALTALVAGGRLRVDWEYSEALHQRSSIERLAQSFLAHLRELIDDCCSRRQRRIAGYTPSDFPLSGLDEATLASLLGEEWGIEDLYPLSPLQEGILFHGLYAPGSGSYVGQLVCDLETDLDVPALGRACRQTLDQHPALRTAFLWHPLPRPLQKVHEQLEAPLQQEDWRGLPDAEQRQRLAALLQADRERGFDLARAPLMRWTLIRTGERRYRLLWTHHHLVLDGWSFSLVAAEFLASYQAWLGGEPADLPWHPPYREYIAWLAGRDPAKTEEYWRHALAGLTEPTSLSQGPLPGRQGAGMRQIVLTAARTAALQARARSRQLTVNTLVQGAWGLLLARSSARQDVIFGATVSGRPAELPGVESMVGLFINTLPVRLALTAQSPLFPWLRDLQRAQSELRHYEHSSLVEIQGWSEVPRGQALFESILVFENYPLDASLRQGSGALGIVEVSAVERSDYPLALVTGPGDEMVLSLEYDRSRFDDVVATRLLDHLRHILAGMAEPALCADAALHDLPWLSAAERQQVLVEWSRQAGACADACIHELFERQVDGAADSVAVSWGDAAASYGELDVRANRLAHRLRDLGVGADVFVGLCAERSMDMVIAILGILKSGGAYVPLDPTYPAERLSFMFEDARLRVLITQERLLPGLPFAGTTRLVLLNGGRGESVRRSSSRLASRATPSSLAYLMYTSGSTGRPQGVAVPHRAVARLVRETTYAHFGADEVFLQLAPISFDASTLELWGPLLNGGRLAIHPPGAVSLRGLGEELGRQRVTSLWLTAGLFHEMVDGNLEGLRPVRQLLAGGDVLSPSHVRRVLVQLPGCRVINGYGPTEGTTFTCCHPMAQLAEIGRSVPLGRPIAGTGVFLLDPEGMPVPAGVTAELWIGGVGLARGYWNRPDLTARRWVPDPVTGQPGGRLYRSGDLARFLPDGRIEFLGRIDHQVKIRGFRLEPGEIEAVLTRHPGVREAAVAVREDPSPDGGSGDRRLVAYIAGRDGFGVDAGEARRELIALLGEHLPDHMLPGFFSFLQEMPRTPTGKVDRRALPAPAEGAAAVAYTDPRDPYERELASIWSTVLGVARVGVEDDFFALGGHSLLAIRLGSQVRDRFGVELPLRQLFEEPTVAGLAAWLRGEQGARARFPAPPIRPVPRRGDGSDVFALSFGQRRLWFLDRLAPGSPVYNIPFAVRLTGGLDAAVLAVCLGEIVRRHEPLRTTFRAESEPGAEPVQVVSPAGPFPLPLVDLTGLGERAGEPARWIGEEDARLPFDLARGPLFRPRLLRLAQEDHVLLASLHHIAGDAWSMGVLVRELLALYEAFSRGLPCPLPELPVQYADYALWQREWFSGAVSTREMDWWREHLRGVPALLELPTDRPRPAVQRFAGDSRPIAVPAALAEAIPGLARQAAATPFMVLLAALQVLLMRASGRPRFAVGSPVAGRGRSEIEGLIGLFVNTLVIPADLGGDPTFYELLAQARHVVLETFGHQDTPFEKLVEELRPERSLSHSPLFQVMLALQSAAREERELPGLTLTPLEGDNRAAKFDLTFDLAEAGGGLTGRLEYDTDLFDSTTIARWAEHLEIVLAGVVDQPRLPCSELPLCSAAQAHQLAYGWNESSGMPASACFPQLFAAQVARAGETTALIAGGERWSYGRLGERVGSLARRLQGWGVGPELLVGVAMERSPEMVVAMLAILAAGGAYVPLDPEYPRDRLAFMLEDARLELLLTQERLLGRLPDAGVRCVAVDAGEDATDPWSPGPVRCAAGPENAAYVIYTSGSTGLPKGVVIRHAGTAALLAWAAGTFAPERLNGVLASTSICFDLSVFELLVPLASGGTVILARDALELPELPAAREVTLINTVPSAIAELIRARSVPESVRTVVLAGEPLRGELVEKIYQLSSVEEVYNFYGPSEDTTYSTGLLLRRDRARPVTIGHALAKARAYVLDPGQRLAPIGVAGELWLGGDGLARGYFRRPELTADRFRPDPFAGGQAGSRLYRTGDLVRRLADGEIDFLGRLDRQVKIRGFRIELGEIEAALARLPGVRESVVVVREGPGEIGGLVAYVVPEPGAAFDVAALWPALRERLPGYMVPGQLIALRDLPLTPNGKVDRDALSRNGPPAAAIPREEPAAVRSPTQELLARIFAAVLRLETVGPEDDFFTLGGHSLLASQVLSRVRDSLGVELPLRRLFVKPTVAALAREIEAVRLGGATFARPPLGPVARQGKLPLSFAQQRLWTLEQLTPGHAVYNTYLPVRLRGDLRSAALAQAVNEVVRRHEVLRTCFPAEDGEPFQLVHPSLAVLLPAIDLRALAPGRRESEVRRLALAEAQRPFDLERGPLLRSTLVHLDEEEAAVVLTMHHIVSDGWSMGILLRELAAFYLAFARGQSCSLPALPVQYADFAYWQRVWLSGEVMERHLDFWRRHLEGAPRELRLPADHPRPAMPSHRGRLQTFALPADLSAGLRELCLAEGVTLFMALIAALDTLFYLSSGQTDIVVGAPIANRNLLETEGLIGFFVNTLPLRVRLAGGMRFRELLQEVKERVLDVSAHQDLPLERLVEELRPDRHLGRSPLYQVVLTLQNTPLPAVAESDLALAPMEIYNETAKFDLTFNLWEEAQGIKAWVEHNTDLFEAATVERLWRHFEKLLGDVVADPQAPLDSLAMFSPEEAILFDKNVVVEELESEFHF